MWLRFINTDELIINHKRKNGASPNTHNALMFYFQLPVTNLAYRTFQLLLLLDRLYEIISYRSFLITIIKTHTVLVMEIS